MSYLMYNPFSPGTQNASQGQTGLFSVKTERDPWRTTPNVGPESSFTFPGASPGTPTSSKEREIKPFSLPISNYRPENYLTTSQSTFNVPHKEEIKHQPIDQGALFTITQKETLSTSAPKMSASYGHQLSSTSCSSYNFLPDHKSTADDFSKLASNVSVYATREEDQPSYFDCNPQLAGNILENYGLEKADLDELLNYSEEQTTAENLPYLLQSIRMKKATRSAPGVRSNSDSMTRPTASTTGVDAVNLGKPGILPDKMSSSTLLHPVKTIKNEEAAAGSAEVDGRNIQRNSLLMDNFQNSSKEGPLPTLIKIKSGDLGSSGDQKGSFVAVPPPKINQTRLLQTQPNQVSGMTRSIGFGQTKTPNNNTDMIIKPVKQFDCAYTGKSITDVENTSVRNIQTATGVGGKDSKEAPQPSVAELKNSSLVSPYDQSVFAAGFNQLNVVAFPKRNATGKLETQQNLTSQSVPQHETRDATSSGENKIQGSNMADSTINLQMLQKTNIKKILHILKDLQPDVSYAAKPDSQSPFIPKMPHVENTSVRNVHNAAGVGGKDGKEAPQLSWSELKNSSLVSSYDQKVSAAGFNQLNVVAFPKRNAAEKLETQQNHSSQSVPQHETRDATSSGENKIQGQGSNIADSTMNLQMLQKTNIQKILQILKDLQPGVSSATKPDSQSPFIPKMPHVSDVVLPSTVVSKNPASSVSQSQPIIKTNNNAHVPSSKPRPPAKTGSSEDLPSLGVRRDYAAVMPGRFPHICSLCNKECPQLKDWVSHQTSNQHHANCNRLRNQYPHWDEEVQRDAIKSSKTLTRASLHHRSRSNSGTCSSSGDGRDKSISRSHSRSYSPRRRRSSRDGKHKYSSRSGHGKNRSSNGSSSRSHSPIRHGSRDRKNHSNGTSSQHRLQYRTSRSRSRSCSPRYNRSGYRSRSRSYEKRSSPKRMNKKSVSPRRTHERRLSRGRSCERRLSPRSDRKEGSKRFFERQSSPRISDYKRLSPRSGCMRQMSPKRTDKRWSPTSNGEHLSPRRSGNRRRSPVMSHDQHSSRSNDRLWSPQRRTDVSTYDKHRSPPRRSDDKHRSPPRRSDDKHRSPPRRSDDKHRSPPRRSDDKHRSPPRRSDDKHRSPPRRSDDKYWSPPKYHDRQSSPRRNDDKRRSPTRKRESFLERDEQQFLSKQSDEEASSVRRNRKRHATPEEEPSCQKKKSSSVRMLTKRLLENSAFESASGQSNIKDVVDLVVPVLLAELAKNQDSSQSSLGLPSQDKRRKVLTHSSSGRQLSPSSSKILSKLKQKHARSSKKTKDKRALSVSSQHRRKHHKLRSEDSKKLGSSESLDHLPIKTLLSLHQKLVKKAKRLSSKGTHVSKSKTCSQKTQALKSVVSVKEPLKQLVSLRFRSLETSPDFGLSNQRTGPIVFRKDQDFEAAVKETTRVKGTRRIIIPEPNEEKKTVTKVKLDSSKTFASKPLDKTAECAGVAKLIKVEDSLGNKQQTADSSQLQLVSKMVTAPSPLQAQETIIKTQETSGKTLPKVQQKMDPESKKSKSLGKSPDSGDTRDKPGANVFKEGRETQVAVKDTTKVGKILKKSVAEAKEMVTKVKVNASKTSSDTLLGRNTKCPGIAKLTKVEESLGDERKTSNVSRPEPKQIKPLIGKVVTRPHPLRAQETIVKTQETSDKTLPKVRPRMDPDSKKSKSLRKNHDSGGTRNKPATKVFKKGKDSQVAVKDRTKTAKMLKKTVAKAMKGKKMVAKVKVKVPKTSTNKKLDEITRCLPEGKVGKLSGTAFGNFSKCDQANVKESEPSLFVSVITSTIPMAENSPGDCQISNPEISKAKTSQFNSNERRLQISQEKEETSSEGINVSSKLTMSEDLSAVCQTPKTDSSGIKVYKAAFLLKDTACLVKANVSTTEISKQTEVIIEGNAMKRKIDFLETNEDEVTARKASPAKPEHPQPGSGVITSPEKPADPMLSQQTTMTTQETPDLAALNLKTNGKQLEVQPRSAGSSAETLLDASQKTEGDHKNNQKVDVLAQKNPAACFPNAAAAALNRVESSVTVGERIGFYLKLHNFKCFPAGIILSSKPYALNSTLLLITNLPVDYSGSYTEEEVVNVLCKFEFQYAHDNIYVIPQTGMAFVLMPNVRSVIGLVYTAVHGHLSFRSKKLFLHIVETDMLMTPLGFYKSLIGITPLNMRDDGTSIIYIQNISPSDIADLRKALRKIGHVRNFLPLLNKVFVEFETVYDADRLGVWCSLMRLGFVHTVNRLKIPRSLKKSQLPKLPLKALPDGEKILPDAGIPDVKSGVPQGTTAPCWVTMMTPPYVFPTVCPWFNIPSFLTVQGEEDILTTPHRGSEFFTVMLTGLPEGKYKHEDVAKLVWRYFPKQNLQTLYYNILVLPLQRRAFVFFCDWEACCSFVSDCVKKPVSVRNCTLSVHLVLEDMYPGSSEGTMYRTLMKWTSGYVPELFSLEKRLVSVEIYEANMNLIESIIKEVAAIGSFISFVPLTNRICIEMVSPSCATKVLQEMPLRKVLSAYLWGKIGRVECVKDLNQRLEEASQTKINLEAETSAVGGQTSALKTLVDFPISEPQGDDAAGVNSAAPPTLIESTVSTSESKLEVKVSPDVVLDSKAEANSREEERQPCREISSAADNSVAWTPHPDEKIQTDPPSSGVSIVPDESTETSPSVQTEAAAEEMDEEQPAGADSCLTAGERIGNLLQPEKICCLGHSIIMSPKPFSLQSRLLLVTNLPRYRDGCYSESDVSNLLRRFGFQYEDTNIFVVPQACMAFVLMESYQKAQDVFKAAKDCLTLNGCKLSVEIISSGVVMTTFGFYKSLMEMIDFPVTDDGTRTVYIQNVSPSEARDLRETLRKMGSVKNFLPLLNKVFIEFESAADADQIGVWYSLQRRCPPHNVSRIKDPQTNVTSLTPHLVATAAPESKDVVAGPIVPPMNTSIPEGSWAPFSVAMTTAPFLFPTVSPWFIIPKFRTVDGEEDLLASVSVASKFSTVMLTGLPEGNYKHEDVARLVWKNFTKQNLQTLFYSIVVLPLQKRAFVYFNDWRSCNNFVQDFLKKGVSFTSHQLHIHLVLEDMNPGSSEDMVYQTLMKWSNAHVPELESLDERLVCVSLSETSLNLIMATIKLVTNISPVVSFLPLANRLCIEMAESRGVDQVVERFACAPEDWNSQVQSVESVKSLKLRLRDSGETIIDLERNTEDINDKTSATKNEPQPPSSDTPVKTKPPVQEATHLPNNAPSTEEMPAKGSGTKIEIGGTENENVRSRVTEKQFDVCGKVEESAVVPRNKTETEKKKQQAKIVEVKEDKSENVAKSKVGKTEDEKSSPAKPTKTLISTPVAETQPSTPLNNPHLSPQTSLQTSVKAPSQLQKYINPKPASSAENPKTKTNISGNSAAVKNPASKASAASAEIIPNTKSSTTATKSEPLAATTSTEAFPLTPGEKLHHFLTPFKLCQLDINTILSPVIFSLHITLVVTNLPRWFDGSYTETEIINVLQKCRVQCDENEIFIVPQSQMAFLIMPKAAEVQHLFRVTPWRELFFKGRNLGFHVVTSSAPMTLFRFYRYLMSFTDFPTFQMKLGTKNVLYFPNISASEARDLREALRKISSFINYLPLLNRVFVHCETPEDADRLEAWYSYWRWSRSHDAQQTALSVSAHGLQIWENISVETSVPQTAGAIPEGTKAPFWMSVTKGPYVVHTASPFFKVPAFRTVDRNTCARISERDLKFAAIMLTGLPNRSYTHEEVAMLVWRHFPEQNLHTLYNNVVVLPLQRRAFVIFSSSSACIRFLRDRNRKRVYFKGFIPNIHLLLEDLSLGSSEESMFRSLMKWSNIHVPDLTSLGERLLVVEASGTNEHITMMVMKEVASIATFASFLPLANRIYIEMAESSGVRKVVEKLSVRKLSQQHEAWNLVGRVESLLSRKERLKDCEKIAVNLELGTMSVKPEAAPLKAMDKRSATCNPLPDRSLTTSHKAAGFLQISNGSCSSFKSPSSSKPTTKEMKISYSSSATRDIPKSNKDCKSSALCQ
ncbi:uncharacterized protein LOC122820699 [Gambusia affinis]|uniref:uncharacterized protein LOC122820699 n=1 Tax=Gambusia affinis TaxID=33528 RepID=UPI001CDBDC62|nr:uncharacterized protein LOC122820699 [Gambusia affinis]